MENNGVFVTGQMKINDYILQGNLFYGDRGLWIAIPSNEIYKKQTPS